MITRNLLPHSWRPFGWVLLIVFLPLSTWYLFGPDTSVLKTKIQPMFTIEHETMLKLPFLIDNRDDKSG
jgi:hypothetical protein